MARTNWGYGEVVTENDMNQMGEEINANTDQTAEQAVEITSLQNEVQNTLAKASVSLSNTAPVQSFTADVAGPVDLSFAAPDMLVNLLGRDGDFENGLSKWTLLNSPAVSTEQKVFGTQSLKFTAASQSATYDISGFINGHIYFISAYLYKLTSGNLAIQWQGGGAFNSAGATGSWLRRGIIKTYDSSISTKTIQLLSSDSSGGYFDGVMIIDLTALGESITDVDQLMSKYQYINGIQPLVNPMVKVSGKNIYDYSPPRPNSGAEGIFSLIDGGIKCKTSLTSLYYAEDTQKYRIKSSTPYHFKAYQDVITTANSRFVTIVIYDKDRTYISEYSSTVLSVDGYVQMQFTTPSNAYFYNIMFARANNAGAFEVNYTEIQLEEGSTATAYEPYKESSIILSGEYCKIGSYTDTVKFENGVTKKLAAVKKIALDGSLAWEFGTDGTGLKQVAILLAYTAIQLNNTSSLSQKYDGKILRSTTGSPSADDVYIFTNNKYYMAIADTESGFGETYTPSTAEIQALMNGWKMNNGTFGTAYNGSGTKTWTAWNATSNTGAVTTVPTTKAPGWDRWATLWYALATPAEELIDAIGSLGCFAELNTISVETGMTYEKATLAQNKNDSKIYGINIQTTTNYQTTSKLQYKAKYISTIYALTGGKTINVTNSWTKGTDSGQETLFRSITSSEELAAEYYVLYQMLPEEYNNQQISLMATYQQNLLGAHNAVAETVGNVAKDVTLFEMKQEQAQADILTKANRAQENWITATLQNGATGTMQYAKNDLGLVTIQFEIQLSTITALTIIATMPVGYRPQKSLPIPMYKSGSGGYTGQGLYLDIGGYVKIPAEQTLATALNYSGQITYYAG